MLTPLDGTRLPFYNRSSKGDVTLLKTISDEKLAHALDSIVGPTWRELRPDAPKVAPSLEIARDDGPLLPPAEGLSELDRWFPRGPDLEIT